MDNCSLKDTVHGPFYNCAHRDDATLATSTFCLRQEKDDQKVVLEEKDLEVIGAPIIKYGDSTVIVQHSESGLWLSYKVCVSAALLFSYCIQLMRTTLPFTTLHNRI